MVGFDGTVGAVDSSAAALIFLGRPLCRSGVMAFVDAEGGWGGGVGSVEVDVGSSVVKASGNASLYGHPRREGVLDQLCVIR